MATTRQRKKVPNLTRLVKQAATDGVITCPQCGCLLEPDGAKCGSCGWKNILVLGGLI